LINRLREAVGNIVVYVDAGDYPATMREIARFTVLFDEFLRRNKDYLFGHEIKNLNRYMYRMLACMEEGDLGGLVEIAESALRGLLDDWDFHNKPAN